MTFPSALKKSLFFVIIILAIGYDTASAQTIKTGFWVGINRHTAEVIDDENGILQANVASTPSYGITVMVVDNQLSFHTGFFLNDISTAFAFKTAEGTAEASLSGDLSTYKVPVFFSRKFMLTESISLSPKAGFSWITNGTIDTTGTFEGSLTNNSLQVEYEAVSMGMNENIFMAEAGLDLNIRLNWIFMMKLSARYSFGLQPIEETEINYRLNNESYTGTLESSGSGWNFNVGLVIPFYN